MANIKLGKVQKHVLIRQQTKNQMPQLKEICCEAYVTPTHIFIPIIKSNVVCFDFAYCVMLCYVFISTGAGADLRVVRDVSFHFS